MIYQWDTLSLQIMRVYAFYVILFTISQREILFIGLNIAWKSRSEVERALYTTEPQR